MSTGPCNSLGLAGNLAQWCTCSFDKLSGIPGATYSHSARRGTCALWQQTLGLRRQGLVIRLLRPGSIPHPCSQSCCLSHWDKVLERWGMHLVLISLKTPCLRKLEFLPPNTSASPWLEGCIGSRRRTRPQSAVPGGGGKDVLAVCLSAARGGCQPPKAAGQVPDGRA